MLQSGDFINTINMSFIEENNIVKDGFTYSKRITPLISINEPIMSASQFYNQSWNTGEWKRAWLETPLNPEWNYQTYLMFKNNLDELAAFKQLQFPNGATININQYYNISELPDYLHDINELPGIANPDFNPLSDIDEFNYPLIYPVSTPISPSTLPNNNPGSNPNPNPENQPSLGENIGNISDPILPENIPFLSNLEFRFPFSIPFDMYKLLKGLSVPRETPIINTTIVIPRLNYEWNIYYDMAPFNDTVQLFRTLFLISYIIGLAYFSYDHFFGS